MSARLCPPRHYAKAAADVLTPAETALMRQLQETPSIRDAAAALGIAYHTASERATRVREKLFVATTAEAVQVWKGMGS